VSNQNIFKLQKQNFNINSLPVCAQFKTTTTKPDQVSIKTRYIQITNKNKASTHVLYGQFKATKTKTDQVSTKPKYIQITNN